MGIGYYTLHSSCGTYLAIGQDTQYPLEGISLDKCYSGCAFSVSASAALHCGDPLGQTSPHVRRPTPAGGREGGRKQFSSLSLSLSLSLPVHTSSALMRSVITWLSR